MDDPEVRVRPLLWAALAVVLVLAAAAGVSFWLLGHWGLDAGGEGGAADRVRRIPEPRLQIAPQAAPEFKQRLGARVDGAWSLRDADGRAVDRAALFDGRHPVVLLPAWYRCDTLCGTVAHGAIEALADTGLAPDAWRLVLFSIDPADTPADAHALRDVYRHYATWARPTAYAGAPLHLQMLSGREADTRLLTDAIGYAWHSEAGAIAHPAGLVVMTPEGAVSRYFLGVRFAPTELRAALLEAADGRVGTLADRLLLACAHLDPRNGVHSDQVLVGMRLALLVTMAALGGWVWHKARRA